MSITPDFIGQRYKDTNTGNIWRANSTTPGDWTLEVQDAKMAWTPRFGKWAWDGSVNPSWVEPPLAPVQQGKRLAKGHNK